MGSDSRASSHPPRHGRSADERLVAVTRLAGREGERRREDLDSGAALAREQLLELLNVGDLRRDVEMRTTRDGSDGRVGGKGCEAARQPAESRGKELPARPQELPEHPPPPTDRRPCLDSQGRSRRPRWLPRARLLSQRVSRTALLLQSKNDSMRISWLKLPSTCD
eukprot:6213372-Pleurochrysis_carterae.AAC.1